jgi:WD40 repeat protein
MQFSPDSSLLAYTTTAEKGTTKERMVVAILPAPSLEVGNTELIELPRGYTKFNSLAFSPDSKLLAIGGSKKFGIFSLRPPTGMPLAEGVHPGKHSAEAPTLIYDVNYVEFSPDGTVLITGGEEGTVKLWKLPPAIYQN